MKLKVNNREVKLVIIDVEDQTVQMVDGKGAKLNFPLTRDGSHTLHFAQSAPAGHALQAFLLWARNNAEGHR